MNFMKYVLQKNADSGVNGKYFLNIIFTFIGFGYGVLIQRLFSQSCLNFQWFHANKAKTQKQQHVLLLVGCQHINLMYIQYITKPITQHMEVLTPYSDIQIFTG